MFEDSATPQFLKQLKSYPVRVEELFMRPLTPAKEAIKL